MNTFSPAALGQIAVDALDGFLNMFSIGDALSAVFGDLPGIVKSVLGISSPSTVFAELGGNVTDGFSGSVEEMPAKMAEQMQQLIAVATENMMQMMNMPKKMATSLSTLIWMRRLRYNEKFFSRFNIYIISFYCC